MSAYKRMKVTDLQNECEARGINYLGLNKRGMLAALRRNDEDKERDGLIERNVEQSREIDEEITFRAVNEPLGDSGSIAGSEFAADVEDGDAGSETVQIMKLKLALAREERQREKERDERAREMREREFEMDMQRAGMRDGSRGPFPARPVKPEVQSLLPRMSNDADLIVFFQSYERALLLNDVPKSEWSKFLPANLTAKANKVLAGLTLQDVKDYEVCKRAILAYFQLNEEAYLKKFRSARKTADENYKMFASRLKDCFLYYVESKEIDSFESLADAVICEQFLFALPSDAKQFVVSRQAKTVDECSNLADVYQEMTRNEGGQSQCLGPAQGHGQGSGQGPKPTKTPGPTETSSRFTQRFAGPKPVAGNQNNGSQGSVGIKKPVLCYACQSPSHKYVDCPQRSRYNAGVCAFCSCYHPYNVACNQRSSAANGIYAMARNDGYYNFDHLQQQQQRRQSFPREGRGPVIPIYVNGRGILALRDTGCQGPTLIHPDYIDKSDYTGEHILLRGAFDGPNENHRVPLAVVNLRAPSLHCDRDVSVTVGVWPLAEFQCIVGNSLFRENSEFSDIFSSQYAGIETGHQSRSTMRRRGDKQKINNHTLSQSEQPQTTENGVMTGHRHTDGGVAQATHDAPTTVKKQVMHPRSDRRTDWQRDRTDIDEVQQANSDNGKQKCPLNGISAIDDSETPDTDGYDGVGSEQIYDAAPSIGHHRQTETLTPGGGSDTTELETASDQTLTVGANGQIKTLMNSADGRKQDAGKVPTTRGRDKLQGETDVDRPTLTRGVLSDGAEEVNQLNTVRVTTRAKRRETDRSQTENEFMRNGSTATEFKGDTDTQTYEPAVETESRSDRETDDTPSSDEIDFTDQTVRELSGIDVTDKIYDEGVINAETDRQFAEAQRSDKGLASYWQRARAGCGEFVIIRDLLHRRNPSGDWATAEKHSLVVPQCYEKDILKIAHTHPFAGHLGRNKCKARITNQFWFPKMKQKIANYIKKCHECQITAGIKTRDRAPLQSVHVMHSHPFQEIEIDVLGGNLPVTARRNKYLLTIVCSNSKWVEAIPMANCKAETIAEKLIGFFSYASIPRIIRMDNMPSFRSEILTALRGKLGIAASFSAPYHPTSHGGIERTNRTIEEMLRKFTQENPKQWDKLIPYLLFALREVPNSSTKFSPAELVYGRKFRGLLAVMRENWTFGNPLELNMPAAKYIQQLNERIETALKAARENVQHAQQRNKDYYDKQSSERCLESGDLALILMPTDNNKLTATWQGPYRVIRRGDNNNYILDVDGRQAMLHINALRKYHQDDDNDDQAETVNLIISGDTDLRAEAAGETDEAIKQQADERYAIGEQLTDDQRAMIKGLLDSFPDIFTEQPGCTHLIQHEIKVTDETPSYQTSYRIPEGMRDAVEEELKTMEKNGIIQYDPNTTWNSPLIIVKKPNGKIRLVNNFIRLNEKTINEQHTMSRPEELVNRVAGAKYISRIDLRSAFHQCLLSPESRKYTGFQTPFGSFVYCRMAMGLKCASATCQRLIDRAPLFLQPD